MRNNLEKLINVKSIVTLLLTFGFVLLSAAGKIGSEQFQTVFSTVIAFYFGTQHEKRKEQ